MANLSETSQWVDGIYQLETSDPVEGGPNGISNRQAQELANRTNWLKNNLLAQPEALPLGDATKWQTFGGAWTFGDNLISQTQNDGGQGAWRRNLRYKPRTAFRANSRITLEMRIVNPDAGAPDVGVGLVIGGTEVNDNSRLSVMCYNRSSSKVQVEYELVAAFAVIPVDPIADGEWLPMEIVTVGDFVAITLRGVFLGTIRANENFQGLADYLFLRAYACTAEFRNIEVREQASVTQIVQGVSEGPLRPDPDADSYYEGWANDLGYDQKFARFPATSEPPPQFSLVANESLGLDTYTERDGIGTLRTPGTPYGGADRYTGLVHPFDVGAAPFFISAHFSQSIMERRAHVGGAGIVLQSGGNGSLIHVGYATDGNGAPLLVVDRWANPVTWSHRLLELAMQDFPSEFWLWLDVDRNLKTLDLEVSYEGGVWAKPITALSYAGESIGALDRAGFGLWSKHNLRAEIACHDWRLRTYV